MEVKNQENNPNAFCTLLLVAPSASACKESLVHFTLCRYVKEYYPVMESGRIYKIVTYIGDCTSADDFREKVSDMCDMFNRRLKKYGSAVAPYGKPKQLLTACHPELYCQPTSTLKSWTHIKEQLENFNRNDNCDIV